MAWCGMGGAGAREPSWIVCYDKWMWKPDPGPVITWRYLGLGAMAGGMIMVTGGMGWRGPP